MHITEVNFKEHAGSAQLHILLTKTAENDEFSG